MPPDVMTPDYFAQDAVPVHEPATIDGALDGAIDRASQALDARQNADGHWMFELEADATIPAEYILLEHYLDRIDAPLQAKIAVYLRRVQGAHGGWPLFHDGAFDLSATVKAYYALKCVGDSPDAPHMQAARDAILAAGGAERANVFTRIQLALYGQVPWRAVPVMPVEIMHLPRWFFFHLSKVSYWSRTVLVPLLVLMALRPRARNPRGVDVQELFCTPPEQIRNWLRGPYRSAWGRVFMAVDHVVRIAEPALPTKVRARAIEDATRFVTDRLNGEDGLGAIYPAMANSVMMFDALGHGAETPEATMAWAGVRKLLVVNETEAYCQPCLSPIWDTSLAGHAVAEAQGVASASLDTACAWLVDRQVTDLRGDWAVMRPDATPGGWAFQYENAYYPDVDDTAVVGMLLHRNGDPAHADSVARARDWVLGMQSENGGWGAFDADNNHEFLNHIPFADHGALLDPPTADVTARCVSFLAQIGLAPTEPCMARAIQYLKDDQEADGSWFGRWGTNYIYGTWSVLCALNAAGVDHDDPCMVRARTWLIERQQSDGGWGEDGESYADAAPGTYHTSTASQTAWAILGLMAAGECGDAVERGAAYLAATQRDDGEWDEQAFTAVGFPRVFYLRYDGYRLFFPLMALARFRNLRRGNSRRVGYGF